MSKFYIEVHSTMTDDTFYLHSSDVNAVELSIPLVKKLIHSQSEAEYLQYLHDIELNGLVFECDWSDNMENWDRVAYIEDRF